MRLYISSDLRPLDSRMSVLKSINEAKKRFKNGPPLLDPVEDMKIKDKGLKEVVKKIEAFEHRLYSHPLHKDPGLADIYAKYESKAKVSV